MIIIRCITTKVLTAIRKTKRHCYHVNRKIRLQVSLLAFTVPINRVGKYSSEILESLWISIGFLWILLNSQSTYIPTLLSFSTSENYVSFAKVPHNEKKASWIFFSLLKPFGKCKLILHDLQTTQIHEQTVNTLWRIEKVGLYWKCLS